MEKQEKELQMTMAKFAKELEDGEAYVEVCVVALQLIIQSFLDVHSTHRASEAKQSTITVVWLSDINRL